VVRSEVSTDELPTPVRATGWLPSVRAVGPDELPAESVAASAELLDQVEGTVGVITAMGRRGEVSGWLAELIEKSDSRLRVVGSLEAKGLEYDAVLLVQPSELVAESVTGRRALYVALSRATQRLTILSDDDSWRTAARQPPDQTAEASVRTSGRPPRCRSRSSDEGRSWPARQ
jgi:UvrD-like helicase C-terminal domain